MWMVLAILSVLLCDKVSFSRPVQVQSVGSPWPLPQKMNTTEVTFTLASHDAFRIYQETEVLCPVLDLAFTRYFNIIFTGRPEESPAKADSKRFGEEMTPKAKIKDESSCPLSLTGLAVSIVNCDETFPSLSSSEEYTLFVDVPEAVIIAQSVWGALRGLETFSQILYKSTLRGDQLIVNKTTIVDYPRFRHRGFLVDTARHYLPVHVLLQFLDAMSYNKFNVLHWHIVDDQSFPYESTTFPFMSQMGSYTPSRVYSQKDVSAIITYARDRGIRVLPEFDTPGHTQSWGSVKGLLTPCKDKSGKPTGAYGPVNPILNSTYDFLRLFFGEVSRVFPDDYMHVGGDEVKFDCWKSNKDVQAFMTWKGFGQNYTKLESFYMRLLTSLLQEVQAKPVVWQEVVDNGAKNIPEAIVQVWKEPWQGELANLTRLGYQAIVSTPWYLNRAGDPYVRDWMVAYKINPLGFKGTKTQKALVLGGEACMWGEYVDATNLIQRSWPRGSAVAERLWSASKVRDPKAAAPRLAEHRCRMLRRGIEAQPVTGTGFCL